MDYDCLRKFLLPLAMFTIASGCLKSDMPTTRSGFQVIPPGETIEEPPVIPPSSLPPTVEVRHLIEPNLSFDPNYSSGTGEAGGGTYKRKITIPKNFQGRIYVAGINIATLADRHVKVRFRFGVNRDAITIPGTISRAPGITPSTNIHVLVLDLRSEPFRDVRLPYDLFDYNEYADGEGPVQDNLDSGLYCRGLRLEDDPTFNGVNGCDAEDELCLYSFAKVLDQGLVRYTGTNVPIYITPSLPQTRSESGTESYYQDYLDRQLMKPLLDHSPTGSYIFSQVSPTIPGSLNRTFADPFDANTPINLLGNNYFYRGPYRITNLESWHYKLPLAGTSSQGRLFRRIEVRNGLSYYYQSYLFPLATKLDLDVGVAHMSSENNIFGSRDVNFLLGAGETYWMDGSNARAMSRNYQQEHIGSCNVSASIEIIAQDDNNNDFIVSLARDVKLQLVRPSQHHADSGDEVLFTNFKHCLSNAGCGSGECCFNERCWDQSLVSQCFDSTSGQGNLGIGQNCSTDLQCSSLCCNRTTGRCAPHSTITTPPVLCSKPQGDFCISKEWCQKEPVTRCIVVQTGIDPLGNVTCRQQCYTTLEHGDCTRGICVPPAQTPPPVFDPTNPNACANAVPPPRF